MIVDKINKYLSDNDLKIDYVIKQKVSQLAGYSFENKFMNSDEWDSAGKVWFSSVGKCARQLAYQFYGYEKLGKESDGRSKLTFFTGDMIELVIAFIAKLAGVPIVGIGTDQARLSVPINGTEIEISGRPDGIVLANPIHLVEFKSMSSFGFRKFEAGKTDISDDLYKGISLGYAAQINMGMYALGINHCVFVGYNKDSNVMHEVIYEKDPEIIDIIKATIKALKDSTKDILPNPRYTHDEKGKYPWQCLYCSYWGHCKTNAEKVLKGKAYILKEKTKEEQNETNSN